MLFFCVLNRYLAATVFRPGFARRAFPCFDEPHMRAPFRISVFRDRFHIGLSNSIVHATDDVGFYMGTGLVSEQCSATNARYVLVKDALMTLKWTTITTAFPAYLTTQLRRAHNENRPLIHCCVEAKKNIRISSLWQTIHVTLRDVQWLFIPPSCDTCSCCMKTTLCEMLRSLILYYTDIMCAPPKGLRREQNAEYAFFM